MFVDKAGLYLDGDSAEYSIFSNIVDEFPAFEGDDVYLDCKSLEKYPKRCYERTTWAQSQNPLPLDRDPAENSCAADEILG